MENLLDVDMDVLQESQTVSNSSARYCVLVLKLITTFLQDPLYRNHSCVNNLRVINNY